MMPKNWNKDEEWARPLERLRSVTVQRQKESTRLSTTLSYLVCAVAAALMMIWFAGCASGPAVTLAKTKRPTVPKILPLQVWTDGDFIWIKPKANFFFNEMAKLRYTALLEAAPFYESKPTNKNTIALPQLMNMRRAGAAINRNRVKMKDSKPATPEEKSSGEDL